MIKSDLPVPNWQSERPYMPDSSVNNSQTERYKFAAKYCINKEVLDLFAGDGFGSEIIAKNAKLVFAIDYSEEAVKYAEAYHKKDNIIYLVDKFPPIRLSDASFDVVVALEAIEHVQDDNLFLSEVKRLLRPSGVFIVCTPIRDDRAGIGRWHCREYNETEFRTILSKYFALEEFISPFPYLKHMAVCRKC